MSTIYELPFDEESGRFKAETIIAEVLRTGYESSCEIESAAFVFPEDILQLDIEFEAGATEVKTEVSLVDDVYEKGDFLSIVAEDIEVELKLVPREYDAGGNYGLGPAVSDSCVVKCGDIPLTGTLKIPLEDQLPIPAVGEEITDVVIRVTMGSGGRPWQGIEIKWERLEGACKTHGLLESITETTDEEGEIQLAYTAPKLFYTSGAKFFEEYQFYSESGEKRQDVFRLKIPLAPYVVFQLKAEKSVELDGAPYGIRGPLTPIVEIDPRERVKIIEGEARLKASAEGEERDFPVVSAEFTLVLGDEDGVDEEQEGLVLKTDAQGKFRWEIPELVEAFGRFGRTYQLSVDQSEMPELEMTEATEKAVGFFESRFRVSSVPGEVFQGDVGARLRTYRIVHAEHLATQESQAYERVRSAMEMLGIGVRFVVPFHKGFSQQFAPLLGVLGDTFWDCFNYIWNLKSVAQKIFQGLVAVPGWIAGVAEKIVKRAGVSPGYLRALLGKFKPVSWAMSKMAAFIEWLGSKISGLGELAASLAPRLRAFAETLARQNREIFDAIRIIKSKGIRALGGLVITVKGLLMGIVDALRFLFEGLSTVLQRFSMWLLTHAAVGLKMAGEQYVAFMQKYCSSPAIQKGLEFLKRAMDDPESVLGSGGQGVFVQAGNYLQEKVEAFLGKGEWTGIAANSAVSKFATLNCFNPGASLAVDQLYRSCADLDVATDTKIKHKSTINLAAGMTDFLLTFEKGFIFMEAIKMFVGSMKIPVQVALAAVVTLTTLGTGLPAVAAMCTKMELIFSGFSLAVIDVPHAATIFLGSYLMLHAYLSAVANLET